MHNVRHTYQLGMCGCIWRQGQNQQTNTTTYNITKTLRLECPQVEGLKSQTGFALRTKSSG